MALQLKNIEIEVLKRTITGMDYRVVGYELKVGGLSGARLITNISAGRILDELGIKHGNLDRTELRKLGYAILQYLIDHGHLR